VSNTSIVTVVSFQSHDAYSHIDLVWEWVRLGQWLIKWVAEAVHREYRRLTITLWNQCSPQKVA